ncbi:MAG: YdeI/OmpD-associated family protein [Ignavibacteria bacterium]|nr:YdeI/OmpD-associated family protein [Ignavibacteria bacterium]
MAEKFLKPPQIKPTFFARPVDFRHWLKRNHASATELWVGFHKKGTGKPSMSWPESVDQALCFGWIDGLRKSFNTESYMIRFTPRKPTSIWSAVNTKRARNLTRLGLMHPAGTKAFQRRDAGKSIRYSFEQTQVKLKLAYEKQFRTNQRAWEFFQSQPPGYRKTATWWVVSAKQEATRQRRLATLISDSEAGRRIAPLRREKSTEI